MIVEDVSLGFEKLGDFPGPYVRWLLEAAGGEGLAAIAFALRDRAAIARCCVGYWDGKESTLFTGVCPGEILVEPRGSAHFGWDPWFVPRHGGGRSFAELSDEEKDGISHRGLAYAQLKAHLQPAEPALSPSSEDGSVQDVDS